MHHRRLTMFLLCLTATCSAVAAGEESAVTLADIRALMSRDLTACTMLTATEKQQVEDFRARAKDDQALAALASVQPPPSEVIRKALTCPTDTKKVAARALTSSPLAGIDQSAILWGLTDFIVRRAQEELDDWFFKNFKRELCTAPEATDPAFRPQPLVRDTCKVLSSAELAELLRAPTVLQAAVRSDLRDLPANATEELRRVVFVRPEKADHRDFAAVAGYLGAAASELIKGSNPLDAFGAPAKSPVVLLLSTKTEPAAARVYQLAFILEAAHAGDELLIPDTPETRRWLVMAVALNAAKRNLWSDTAIALNTMASAESLGALDRLFATSKGIVDLSRKVLEARKTGDKPALLRLLHAVFDEGAGLSQTWLTTCGTDKCKETAAALNDLSRLGSVAVQGDYAAAVVEVFSLAERRLTLVAEFPPEARRAMTFVVSLGTVTDATSAANVITAFAAPRGGYRLKREKDGIYLRLNAYAGFAGSYETVAGERGKAVGPWVPVGIEIGHGRIFAGSLGLFGQVIDLGVLASYRTGSDKTEARPEVGVKQVFSPGAFLVYGFRGAPLSVSLGASYAPLLRVLKAGTTEPAGTKVDAKRYSVAIALDIPLFP